MQKTVPYKKEDSGGSRAEQFGEIIKLRKTSQRRSASEQWRIRLDCRINDPSTGKTAKFHQKRMQNKLASGMQA
jgi:hypothetical protein